MKKIKLSGKKCITASEIGQYHFCSVVWYLQKSGYQPDSLLLESGAKKHREIGRVLETSEEKARKYRLLKMVGYLLLIIAGIIFLLESIPWLSRFLSGLF